MRHIDPELPEGLGEVLSQVECSDVFQTPEMYFDVLESQIMSQLKSDDDAFFEQQATRIFKQVKLEQAIERTETFQVPNGYFGKLETAITAGIRRSEMKVVERVKKTRQLVVVSLTTAAAAIALLISLNRPSDPAHIFPSFAELLEKTELSDEDLLYFGSSEDCADLLIHDLEKSGVDSLLNNLAPNNSAVPVESQDKKKIENKTEKHIHNDSEIPNWDDISEEEILEYLLEEGSADEIIN